MLLSFQYIENVTPFLIHSKSYSVFNLLVMLLHFKYVEFYLVFNPFKYESVFNQFKMLLCFKLVQNLTLISTNLKCSALGISLWG